MYLYCCTLARTTNYCKTFLACHVTHVTLFVRVGEAKGGAVGANEDELPHTICAVII